MPILQIANLPNRADMWHDEATVLTGNALTSVIPASPYAIRVYQSAAANGDSFTNSFWVRAGTYTLYVMGDTSTDRGKIDWYIDGALAVTGQDWYAASGVNGTIQSASVTVVGDGYHTLKGVVNGKNASSSGYLIPLQKYWLKQSAD